MAELLSYNDSADAEALGIEPHEYMRRKKQNGSDAGALFAWPGKVKEEKEKTALIVQTLNDDIMKSAVRPRFKQFWGVVFDRWRIYNESTNLPLSMMVDQAIEFRRQAYDWRTQLEKELHAAGLPQPKTPPPDKPPAKHEDYIKGALVVGGIVGGVWGLSKLIRAFKGSE